MSRRKRPSKRRWKARCDLGRIITQMAIVEHQLNRWFYFNPVNVNAELYRVDKPGYRRLMTLPKSARAST